MVFRPRQATSGTILCLASAILLALVSFNTPLLKSMYFLEATFSTGQYAGRLRLGTLGYCLMVDGNENCVGPTVGYNFNPNSLFNITAFNIPEAISRYLTYALILHIIALGAAVAATILGLFDHISTLSLLCFPTCSAWLTSTCALLAFIFDLVIFYIAKSRIDSVSGASASIGISVWLTLAAWLCAGLSGCAFPLGKRWGSKKRESGDPYATSKYGNNGYDQAMRLHAIQDEQARKKEQDLPRFAEVEREPLTAGNTEDKYLYEEQSMPGGLRRDGSVLNGVGVGYGRRQPRSNEGHGAGGYGYAPAAAAGAGAAMAAGGAYAARSHTPGSGGYGRRPSPSEMSYAGNAGVGAGPGGIDRPQQGQYDYYDPQAQGQGQGQDQYYEQNYNPNGNAYSDPYAGNQSYQPHQNNGYGISPNPTPAPPPIARTISDTSYQPNPFPSAQNQLYPPTQSSGSGYYPNPHDSAPDNRLSTGYGGYEDDGLGAIGMAATQPAASGGYSNTQIYGSGSDNQIYQPRPQHLADPRQADILRSPVSEVQHDQYGYSGQGRHSSEENMGGGEAPPPSYGAVPGTNGYRAPEEKAGYTGGR